MASLPVVHVVVAQRSGVDECPQLELRLGPRSCIGCCREQDPPSKWRLLQSAERRRRRRADKAHGSPAGGVQLVDGIYYCATPSKEKSSQSLGSWEGVVVFQILSGEHETLPGAERVHKTASQKYPEPPLACCSCSMTPLASSLLLYSVLGVLGKLEPGAYYS
jgi:hypothetical protein